MVRIFSFLVFATSLLSVCNIQTAASIEHSKQGAVLARADARKHLVVRGAEASVFQAYVDECFRHVMRLWDSEFPDGYKDSKPLSAIVRLTVSDAGELIRLEVLEHSADKTFDAHLLRIIRNAAPFSPFPQNLSDQFRELSIIQTFSVSKHGN